MKKYFMKNARKRWKCGFFGFSQQHGRISGSFYPINAIFGHNVVPFILYLLQKISLLPLLLWDTYTFRQTHFFSIFAIFRHEDQIWEIFRSRIRASRVLTDSRSTFLEFKFLTHMTDMAILQKNSKFFFKFF